MLDRIHHQATLRKVVSDRRASLDEETEIKPAVRKVVQEDFAHSAPVPVVYFPEDGDAVQDSPRLTLVVLDPVEEWRGGDQVAERIGRWTRERRKSPRLYPGHWSGAPESQDASCARASSCGLPDGEWPRRFRRASSALSSTRRSAPICRPGSGMRRRRSRTRYGRGTLRGTGEYAIVRWAEGDRPRRRPFQRERDALRARNHRVEVGSTAQRVRWRRIHRPALASCVQGHRGLAADQPTPEFPTAAAAGQSRPQDRPDSSWNRFSRSGKSSGKALVLLLWLMRCRGIEPVLPQGASAPFPIEAALPSAFFVRDGEQAPTIPFTSGDRESVRSGPGAALPNIHVCGLFRCLENACQPYPSGPGTAI